MDSPRDPPSETLKSEKPEKPATVSAGRRWGARLLLSFTSLFVTCLLLEVCVRLFVTAPAPVMVRDGVYVNTLAKVNGFDSRTSYKGPRLSETKRPGEIRIAVFGESTVQGTPWGAFGSPVTMLRDHLHAVMPDKDVTVLNMGRGGGFAIDAYYFLVSVMRFHPDYVIYFQGANDEYKVDHEMCMPADHPTMHRAWRFLVEHSRLLFTLRAQGPVFFAHLKDKGRKPFNIPPRMADRCDPEKGFQAWTDLLVETAQDIGAKVIVTTPVSNPLRWAELDGQFGVDAPLSLDKKDPHYRKMLACLLTPGCDIGNAWTEEAGNRYPPILWLRPRVRISLEAAKRFGARSIDFDDYLATRMSLGLRPLVFVDEMHLTVEGLWVLSWFWAREVANLIDGRTLAPLPPQMDELPYLTAIQKDTGQGLACIYLKTVPIFWNANMPLVGAVQLKMAIESEVKTPGALAKTRAGLTAQLLAGWLRQHLGMDPELPPPLAAALDDVDMRAITLALQKRQDCAGVGPAKLEPLVVDKGEGLGNPVVDRFFITRDAEKTIGALLGSLHPEGCNLEEAEIRQTFIHASWKCQDGKMATVDLKHPTEAVAKAASIEKTERFAVVPGAPAPAPSFIHDLASQLRTKESSFQWSRGEDQKPDLPDLMKD